MSDVNQGQPVEAQEKTKDVSAEMQELKARMAEQEERFKAQISGLDKRNSLLEKVVAEKEESLKEAEKEKMGQSERTALELETLKAEIAKEKREAKLARNESSALKLIEEKGLPSSLVSYINIEDSETLTKSIESLEQIVSEYVKKALTDQAKKFGTGAPSGGTPIEAPKSFHEAKTKAEKIAYLKSKRE